MSFRFVHTSDWQMGMLARGLGEAGAAVRQARLEALSAVVELARQRQAQALLVAGDLFEDNQVGPALVEQVMTILERAAPLPVHIIPGNHDPYTRESVYRRGPWRQPPAHIHLHTTFEPVALAERVTLYPCPLLARHGMEDPTAWIPRRTAAEAGVLRIGMAHGTLALPGLGEMEEDYFPIPLDAADRLGLDYLALGHFHSTLGHPAGMAARTWYSGTHETTRFGERASGNALVVTLSAGAPPVVEPASTSRLRWRDQAIDLDLQPLADAAAELRALDEPQRTLLRVALTGGSDPAAGSLAELRALLEERFLFGELDDTGLRPASFKDHLASLLGSPYLRQTAEALQALAEGEVGPTSPATGTEAPADPAVARRALQILQEIAWREGKGECS